LNVIVIVISFILLKYYIKNPKANAPNNFFIDPRKGKGYTLRKWMKSGDGMEEELRRDIDSLRRTAARVLERCSVRKTVVIDGKAAELSLHVPSGDSSTRVFG
jgi:hypothetical protein